MTADNAATSRRPLGARRLMPLIVWISVALGVLALVLTGEMGNMIDAFSGADWWLAGPLLAVGCALPIVHARRWQIMLRSLDHELSLESALDLTITSTMINYAAPGYLWSPAKGLLARQMYGIGLGRSVPTLAVEQVVDALALLIGTVAGLILAGPVISREIFDRLDAPSVGVLAVAVLSVFIVAAGSLFVVWRFGRRFAVNLMEAARLLARDRSLRVPVIGFTAARWVLDTLAIWLAAKALGVSLGLSALILISNLPLLIGLISPMPGGIGFREGAMAGVAGVLALPVAAILAAAILHRAALLVALPIVLAAIRLRRWALA